MSTPRQGVYTTQSYCILKFTLCKVSSQGITPYGITPVSRGTILKIRNRPSLLYSLLHAFEYLRTTLRIHATHYTELQCR